MSKISKISALLLILSIAMSCIGLLIVKQANAQTNSPTPSSIILPVPSIPQFSVKYTNSSYEVPASSTTDLYTGQNLTKPNYYVDNESIVFTIKNQPFASYASNGQIIDLYFNIRAKGHYAENWSNVYRLEDGLPTQSNSDYTIISFSNNNNGGFMSPTRESGFDAPYGEMDFQVEALIGYIHRDASQFMAPWVFDGGTSGWSPTQTIAIADNSSSTSINSSPYPTLTSPSPTPSVPEFSFLTILPILLALPIALAIVRKRLQRNV
jgi:hypothetical protein